MSTLELVGAIEAAAVLGVSRQRMSNLRHLYPDEFPKPLAVLACGSVWDKAAVEAFQEWRPKTPGRPAKKT